MKKQEKSYYDNSDALREMFQQIESARVRRDAQENKSNECNEIQK